jgi:hypothetical protein
VGNKAAAMNVGLEFKVVGMEFEAVGMNARTHASPFKH